MNADVCISMRNGNGQLLNNKLEMKRATGCWSFRFLCISAALPSLFSATPYHLAKSPSNPTPKRKLFSSPSFSTTLDVAKLLSPSDFHCHAPLSEMPTFLCASSIEM